MSSAPGARDEAPRVVIMVTPRHRPQAAARWRDDAPAGARGPPV